MRYQTALRPEGYFYKINNSFWQLKDFYYISKKLK
tara:strand:+ start:199 stop:303 length:105 start_codon:yes stop_codon:yes gene_type:complete